MSRLITVHWLPQLFRPEDLRGGVAVVIDVLRASSTITKALSVGAKSVCPCETIDAAKQIAANLPPGSFLLGGERQGVKIEGFDLGNSPLEYTPETVADKTVVFTTTNGTRALERCRQADRVLIGCFNNLSAVLSEFSECDRPVHLVCAGTDGAISGEDVLCAGMIAVRLMEKRAKAGPVNDATRLAMEHCEGPADLFSEIRQSQGGRNLQALGYNDDIEWAAVMDRFDFVPEYDLSTRQIENTVKQKNL